LIDRHGGHAARVLTTTLMLIAVSMVAGTTASERAGASRPKNFVFFERERHRISEPAFLENKGVTGAQLKYTWRELEPERDRYELQPLLDDLAFLEKHGKRLFVQLQDVSFSEEILVPDYICKEPAFGGGVSRKYDYPGDDESKAQFDGWVARRWDPAVRDRFIKLLEVLGREVDGRIEGINLPETSVGFGESGKLHPEGFTYEKYVEAVKAIMTAARRAFPRSYVIQYANFMPGEWLPWTDHGYLRAVYAHAESIGVGVGGPDLLPFRNGQQNHSYPLIAARRPGIVAGVAVQYGNLEDRDPATGEPVTVEALYRFATETLRLDYIFWGTQEPYYSEKILPFLRENI
jgi:hypothetical protein